MRLNQAQHRTILGAAALFLLACTAGSASAADNKKSDFDFQNVVDNTTQGFAGFGIAPAINNAGAVAFLATGSNFGQGIFRAHHGEIKTIASGAGHVLNTFGETVAINSGGLVGFSARFENTPARGIFTGNGSSLTTVVNSVQQGLVGGQFLGLGGMNGSGSVVFLAFRSGFASQAIFTGNGGPLSIVADTLNSNFQSLGNADINDSGEVAFRAFRPDGTEGIFAGPRGSVIIADTTNGANIDFLDPVINNAGVVADAASLSNGGSQVFTGKGGPIKARATFTPNEVFFLDNVTMDNSGTVAFFAQTTDGAQSIYLQTDSNAPVAMVRTGDPLFGSIITSLSIGRFALNEHRQVVFNYTLQNGRSGIAIVSAK